MPLEFRLPDVGEGLDEAEVMRWLVSAGEVVERDQAIVEIQTDKALVEIPCPAAGLVVELSVEEGAVVRVGELLFVIEEQGSDGSVPTAVAIETVSTASTAAATAVRARKSSAQRVKASPAVRRLAVELGVDLRQAKGSGAGGRVLAQDVRAVQGDAETENTPRVAEDAAVRAPDGAHGGLGQAAFGRQPLRGIRRVSAKTMARAWSEIPHIHSSDEIDAENLVAARATLQDGLGKTSVRLTMLPLLVMAVARALRRYPLVNASIDMEASEIEVHEQVNIGVAVATTRGLLVPVINRADELDLVALARAIERLSRAARERTIEPGALRGGTFTISNYGSLGGRFAAPIIRPPEAGIMGFGSIRQRPFVVDGAVVARATLPICFGADHRLIDGDLSVAFQEHVKALLSDPLLLLLGA